MTYRIVFRRSVPKDLRRIPSIVLTRIRAAIRTLSEDPVPLNAQKIHGYRATYRLRVGDYRIVYEVVSAIRIITVIRVGHRSKVYQSL